MGLKILPSPLRVVRRESSCGSTLSTNLDFDKKELEAQQSIVAAPRRTRVVFAESTSNQEVYTFERVTEQEREQVWYNSQDFGKFHRQAKEQAAYLRTEDKDEWCAALLSVYRAFRGNGSPQEIMETLQSVNVDMDEYTVGLAQGIIPAIEQDFQLRRQHLLYQMDRLQSVPDMTDEDRTKMMYETSRLSSRASRLFAGYIANSSAEGR
eukprot:scaffold39580_cov244-Amphora_coffeaeformis.AAC.1